jgi:Fe2+ or Zn2+ uptake regulation protein
MLFDEREPQRILNRLGVEETTNRIAILQIILEKAPEPFSFLDIIEKIRERNLVISESAVRQALLLFRIRGIIDKDNKPFRVKERGTPLLRYTLRLQPQDENPLTHQ